MNKVIYLSIQTLSGTWNILRKRMMKKPLMHRKEEAAHGDISPTPPPPSLPPYFDSCSQMMIFVNVVEQTRDAKCKKFVI